MRLTLAAALLLQLVPWAEAAPAARAAAAGRGAAVVPQVGLPLLAAPLPGLDLPAAVSAPAAPALPALEAVARPLSSSLPSAPIRPALRPGAPTDPAVAAVAIPGPPALGGLEAVSRALAELPPGTYPDEASEGRVIEGLLGSVFDQSRPGPVLFEPSLASAADGAPPSLPPGAPDSQRASQPPAPPAPPSSGGPSGRGPRRFLSWAPNLVTGLNLASGVGAIVLGTQGLILPAAGLILLAVVFDMFDGRLARALKVDGPIGVQLDSLADVVSFGAAPAILVFNAALAPWGPAGFAVIAAFAFAGAYRLARFNVMAAAPHEGPKPDSFTGLPIPAGAGVVVGTVLALSLLPAAAALPVAAAMTLLAALAMVSRLPYPAFKKGGLKALALPAAVAAAAGGGLALLGLPALIPAAAFGLYLMTGPAIAFHKGGSETFRKELKRKAFHQSALLYLVAYALIGHPAVVWAMAAWTALFFAVESARIRSPKVSAVLMKVFGGLIREKEHNRLSGAFYVTLGMFATMALYGSNPALVAAAALMLALGDAASVLVGMRFDWIPFKVRGVQRSLGGVLAGFSVAFAIGLATGFAPLAAFGAALAFTAVDVYPVKPDDNLWIPVVGATALFILSGL